MKEGILLNRILLQFDPELDIIDPEDAKFIHDSLSGILVTSDGSLWLGGDETTSLERLSPIDSQKFGNHQQFKLKDLLKLFDERQGEVDIEGLYYSEPYLWLIGSHSTKRKKPKNKVDIIKNKKDIKRISEKEIKIEVNRYILARIPLILEDGKSGKLTPLTNQNNNLKTACLERTYENTSNILMDALKEDPHLKLIISSKFPGKDNGFDIEGLVVQGNQIFIGLRGPVLRGWSIILEIAVEEKKSDPTLLKLTPIGTEQQLYRKHFLNLHGLGIRDLCLDHNKDLIILAGPTMDLDGPVKVFRLKGGLQSLQNDSEENVGKLEVLFEIPVGEGTDHPEGMTLFYDTNQSEALLVVYDSPDQERTEKYQPGGILADVFKL